jgi:hypothetical protein
MDTFRTISKLWPTGTLLNLDLDVNQISGPTTFDRTASRWASDGVNSYEFLFWNTGRHLTNKRHVFWNFSVLGWGTWTATKWYGVPSNGHNHRVHADSFFLAGDTMGSETPNTAANSPIDAASTYASGAYPYMGSYFEIDTENGDVTTIAKDPFALYDFSGWLQLIWGGDDSGDYIESDAGSGGTIGGPGFYTPFSGSSFLVARGGNADLLAAYGYQHPLRIWIDPGRYKTLPQPIQIPDPATIDILRQSMIEELGLLAKTQPEIGARTEFQLLIEATPSMNAEQLRQAVKSIETTLELGKTALNNIKSKLKNI